jgi:hypothetical protein
VSLADYPSINKFLLQTEMRCGLRIEALHACNCVTDRKVCTETSGDEFAGGGAIFQQQPDLLLFAAL